LSLVRSDTNQLFEFLLTRSRLARSYHFPCHTRLENQCDLSR
jgi:hypothetical protein